MASYTISRLLDLPFYTEGPAVDADGNLYFTTLTGGTIGRLGTDGQYRPWGQAGCPNGQSILPGGEHWVCDTGKAAISRFSPQGEWLGHIIQASCAGVAFDTPNDLVVDAAQHLYFSDSVRENGKVCFVGAGGEQRIVAAGLDYANGLVLSADGSRLFVAESYRNRILHIALSGPGVAAGPPEVFAELPFNHNGYNLPDGLAVDRQGRLWVAHYGMQAVHVLSETGELLFTIDTGMPLVSNLCITADNEEGQTILVTGGYGEPGPGALLEIKIKG
ncbi:SMP-30/gluconolactonase/LRE family protein [Chitinophaga sp.]|uniref:SMP-30/gluconolactonase/LRE family protein n=1 Tax=Chitinophaga sp. TaxID=1869181 RepID=UPI0031D8C402